MLNLSSQISPVRERSIPSGVVVDKSTFTTGVIAQ